MSQFNPPYMAGDQHQNQMGGQNTSSGQFGNMPQGGDYRSYDYQSGDKQFGSQRPASNQKFNTGYNQNEVGNHLTPSTTTSPNQYQQYAGADFDNGYDRSHGKKDMFQTLGEQSPVQVNKNRPRTPNNQMVPTQDYYGANNSLRRSTQQQQRASTNNAANHYFGSKQKQQPQVMRGSNPQSMDRDIDRSFNNSSQNNYNGGRETGRDNQYDNITPRQTIQLYDQNQVADQKTVQLSIINARRTIIEALIINKQIKKAMKKRIEQDAFRSSMILVKAVRKFKMAKQIRLKRQMGIFDATIYLEPVHDHEKIKSKHQVEVFGEFTEDNPWTKKIQCKYNQQFDCFTAQIQIRTGQLFKFIINNGQRYTISGRYPIRQDHTGNQNNIYIPNELNWKKDEKKSNKHGHKNLYEVRIQKQPVIRNQNVGMKAQQKPIQSIQQSRQQNQAPQVRAAPQQWNILDQYDNNQNEYQQYQKGSKNNLLRPSQSAIEPQKEFNNFKAQPLYSQMSSTSHYTYLEPSADHTQNNLDFKNQFDEFFGGDSASKESRSGSRTRGFNQSGSHVFQYNEEDDYVANLMKSGNYPLVNPVSFKQKPKSRSNYNFLEKQAIPKVNPPLLREIETLKSFENIFDLNKDNFIIDEAEEKKIGKLTFNQLSNESMNNRARNKKSNPSPQKKPNNNVLNSIKQALTPTNGSFGGFGTGRKISPPARVVPTKPSPAKPSPVRNTKSPPNINRKSPRQPAKTPTAGYQRQGLTQRNNSSGKKDLSMKVDKKVIPSTKQEIYDNGVVHNLVIHNLDSVPEKEIVVNKEHMDETVKISTSQNDLEKLNNQEQGNTKRPEFVPKINTIGLSNQVSQKSIKVDLSSPEREPRELNKNPSNSLLKNSQTTRIPITSNQQPLTLENKAPNKIIDKQVNDVSMENPLDEDQSPMIPKISHQLNKTSDEKNQRGSPITPRIETQNIEEKEFVTKSKATVVPDLEEKRDAFSEISFFYEEGEDDEEGDSDKMSEATKNAPFILIQGAHCQGKAPHQCEDAYFFSDRAFGVSDGVSGWNDYGFSSDQFSLQLMSNSKKMIEKCIRKAKQGKTVGKKHRSSKSSGGMKKSRSFLSMDNLDIEEQNKESSDDEADAQDVVSSLSANSVQPPTKEKGNESDDSATRRARAMKTDRTAGQKKESPLLPPEDTDGATSKGKASKVPTPLTLEEEIYKKLNAIKINQDYINDWEWGKENAATGGSTAQTGQIQKIRQDSPCKQMKIEPKRYESVMYPTFILQQAYDKVSAVGSATAMVAILNKTELSIANIGDSGFLVVRFKNGEPYCPHKSKEQQHAFNIPFQLSRLPTQADLEILRKKGKLTEMAKLKQVLKKKNTVCQDSPDNADDYTVDLKEGDIVVSATDGVFDNLFQHEVLSMVRDYRKAQPNYLITSEAQAQELAKIMVNAAVDKFKVPKGKKTPYQRKYKKTYNATWEGGKEDDITVLVSVARKVRVLSSPKKGEAPKTKVDYNKDNQIFTAEALREYNIE